MTPGASAPTPGHPVDSELADWVAGQRWFSGKGRRPDLLCIGTVPLASDEPGTAIQVTLLLDRSHPEQTLYQVPLTVRADPLLELAPILRGPDGGYLYDGPRDPAYPRALLSLIGGGQTRAEGAFRVTGECQPDASLGSIRGSRVLSGEQSNTSIIVDSVAPDGTPQPLICKIFRTLQPGLNPDVILQSAIATAGSARVPRSVGQLVGEWPGTGADDTRVGHLAFLQEFLPGTEDAWRVALRAVATGQDFREEATALGAATAEVHAVLAEQFGTQESNEKVRQGLVDSMRGRLAAAVAAAPSLEQHSAAIDRLYRILLAASWPRLQRIHGDYHLGQVLSAPGRGWVLLDFEGEPLRPMAERSSPDLAARDLAGMLRSFDYAAGAAVHAHPGLVAAEAWAAAARGAFLAGYRATAESASTDSELLLAALELDKALYEIVYEARNRPDWLNIPVAAVGRLLSGPLAGY